ncbi:hypothetical protein QTP86_032096, partial [Hemibagrus guttatus]
VHTVQRMYGCEIDDGTIGGYDQWGYDGEDFISLDLKTLTWTAAKPEAMAMKNKLDPDDPPTASVIQKHSPSPEVVCHATAFFPKAVNITWRKYGEDVNEDVELRETLPNQDGSFQKRSILKVPAEELQKHTYTCVIQHSSLKEELVLEVPKGGGPMAIIVGVVVALVVLVAVVAGIMVWKKKNSGVHTLQRILGCELDDNGTVRGYNQFSYDGEDFISLDLKTLTWTAAIPQAEIIKNKRDNDTGKNKMCKNFLEYECIEWLKKYMSYSRETPRRKDPPTASVIQNIPQGDMHRFLPQTDLGDGKNVQDVELRETLPNPKMEVSRREAF